MPRVSIIMPVYNGERLLDKSIGSLLNQTCSDIEIIAVDDGSTDGTLEKLKAIASDDDRVVVHTRRNSGRPSIPKNDGLELARGTYVGFLDHDDYCEPDHIQALVEGLDNHREWVAAFHDIDLVDLAGTPQPQTYLGRARFKEKAAAYLAPLGDEWFDCGPDFYEFMSLQMAALHTQSVLIARDRLDYRQIRFDTSFKICDDTDLWMRIGLMGRIGYLDRVLGHYCLHDTNLTRNERTFAQDTVALHLRNFERAKRQLKDDALAKYRTRIAECYHTLAWIDYAALDLAQARTQYRHALEWTTELRHYRAIARTFLPSALIRFARSMRSRGALA